MPDSKAAAAGAAVAAGAVGPRAAVRRLAAERAARDRCGRAGVARFGLLDNDGRKLALGLRRSFDREGHKNCDRRSEESL